mmetsp:Transcript_105746/g.266153  ORF Transcript_105746/g.266153 Transcript_105746/m.266153 type:complete len:146 (+) Transcript_105746:1313-1750(+)
MVSIKLVCHAPGRRSGGMPFWSALVFKKCLRKPCGANKFAAPPPLVIAGCDADLETPASSQSSSVKNCPSSEATGNKGGKGDGNGSTGSGEPDGADVPGVIKRPLAKGDTASANEGAWLLAEGAGELPARLLREGVWKPELLVEP